MTLRMNEHPDWNADDHGVQVDQGHAGKAMVRARDVTNDRIAYDPIKGITTYGVTQTNTFDQTQGDGSIRSTARSQSGSPIGNRELSDNDIVTVDGMEVSVGVAKQIGLLGEDGKDVAPTKEAKPQPKPSADDMGDPEPAERLPGEYAEMLLETSSKAVDAGTQNAAVLDYVNKGELSEGTVGRIASAMGVEPHEAHGMAQEVYRGFEAQAYQTVEKAGVDPQAVFEWAQKEAPEQLSKAMQAHAMQRSTKGYTEVAQAYISNLDSVDPEAILGARLGSGITAKRENGKIVLNLPGVGTVGWKSALKAGLIRVS